MTTQSTEAVLDLLEEVTYDEEMNSGVLAMQGRATEFPSNTAALLAGAGLNENARRYVDEFVNYEWRKPWEPTTVYPEVVIGSGPHALIYAAIRAAKGVKVVLLERNVQAGGSFASPSATFWLNSRNRPGPLSLPGEGKGLNVLPGCPLQPSMISGGEYQTNYDMGWTIRANLMALGIEVHTGVDVQDYDFDGDGSIVIDTIGPTVVARRLVFATGLGDQRSFGSGVPRVLTFNQFMERMTSSQFPLAKMDRVAVVGAGDSGKTVVEALLGQGPTTGMSTAMLDFPREIDWYGCPYSNARDWCAGTRSRYHRIGAALGNRVKMMPRAGSVAPGYESALIGPRAYDWVVNCTGYTRSDLANEAEAVFNPSGQLRVARRASSQEVYSIGPAAALSISDAERQVGLEQIPENLSSLFRYAPRTAAMAASLPVL